jgi:hypothetical protein
MHEILEKYTITYKEAERSLGINGRIMLKLKLWVFCSVAPFWAAVLCRWRQYTFPKCWLLQYLS